ncbi:MAG: dephospho-CoA kinase [Candidatus Omnitrophica bacterium CG1_02_40_15]|nr:MAG: dephospho-CoA kinase [Candidatus Omnitrophica bacterium CG1_02_40_15]
MIIGITGSFGSGKTTVAKMFAKLGAYAIDADKIYYSLIRPKKRCYKKIVKYFGKDILTSSGRIDRKKLGNIVFKDRSKLKLLNSITHPDVIKEIKRIVKSTHSTSGSTGSPPSESSRAKSRGSGLILSGHERRNLNTVEVSKKGKVIIEAPLLIESGFYKEADKVILVANKKEEQVKRIKEERGLSSRKILKRIRMQMPLKKKLAFADFIIDNSGPKAQTLYQVRNIWQKLRGGLWK